MSRRVLFAGAIVAATTAVARAGEHAARVLDGVTAIGKSGSPGQLVVFGEQAEALLSGAAGKHTRAPVVALGSAGDARLVVFAHNGWFGPALDAADGWRLLDNALRWAAWDAKSPRVGVLGDDALARRLTARGFDAEVVHSFARLEDVPPLDVLCGPISDWDARQVEQLERWFARGGGLVGGATPWGWAQLHPGKDIATDLVASRIVAPFGIAFADGFANTGKDGLYESGDALLALCEAPRALDELLATRESKDRAPHALEQAGFTVSQALRWAPLAGTEFGARVRKALAGLAMPVPTESAPVKAERALERVLLATSADEGLRAPADQVRAHPAAAAFPGDVPADAPRVARDVEVDLSVPRWHSTGLYAAPGEALEVTLSAKTAQLGLRLRIGAHQDDIAHHDAWKRAPRVTREESLAAERVHVASPFGGLVYVVVPKKISATRVTVRIANAVEAPRFVLGATDPAEWKRTIRARAAPWAELESARIVLTVPSESVRAIDDPTEVLRAWDVAMDAAAELAGIARERPSPERFVCDVQISAGYMHSGYPIMAHLDSAEFVTTLAGLREHGWGPFHEVGHNHQEGDWTFAGAGEVSNNVFTLYMLETACGRGPEEEKRVNAAKRLEHWRSQQGIEDAFARWKSDPFLALGVYVDVQQEFGWDVYKRVFREYRALAKSERPANDAEKRDQWLVRLSRACGRDLGPLFTSWGLETSAEARASLIDLERWMPKDRN